MPCSEFSRLIFQNICDLAFNYYVYFYLVIANIIHVNLCKIQNKKMVV